MYRERVHIDFRKEDLKRLKELKKRAELLPNSQIGQLNLDDPSWFELLVVRGAEVVEAEIKKYNSTLAEGAKGRI